MMKQKTKIANVYGLMLKNGCILFVKSFINYHNNKMKINNLVNKKYLIYKKVRFNHWLRL